MVLEVLPLVVIQVQCFQAEEGVNRVIIEPVVLVCYMIESVLVLVVVLQVVILTAIKDKIKPHRVIVVILRQVAKA